MHRWVSSCLWNGGLAYLPRNHCAGRSEQTGPILASPSDLPQKPKQCPVQLQLSGFFPPQCLFSTPLDQSVLDLNPDIFVEHLWEDIQNKEAALCTDRRQHILWLTKRQLLQGKRSLISFETLQNVADMFGRQLGIEALWWAQASDAKEGLNSGQSPALPQKCSEDRVGVW